MQLTDEQQQKLRQWASEGMSLGDIQRQLGEQFELTISFMETRFLLGDLNITLKEDDPSEEAVAEDSLKEANDSKVDDSEVEEALDEAPGRPLDGLGSVTVTLDTIAKPGMMASGTTTFSDGETAGWYLDEMGRLGLNPDTPDYRPTEADLMKFQQELGKAAQRAGLA